MKLKDIAKLLEAEIIGQEDIEITGVSGIEDALEGDITFLSSPKYIKRLRDTKASCVMVKEPVSEFHGTQLKVTDPYYGFAKLLEHFYVKPFKPIGISSLSFVSDDAVIKEDVSIEPFCYVSGDVRIGRGSVIYPGVFIGEGVTIGDTCIIYPNVVLREGVSLGNRVIVHSGSVIGSDGFGYVFHNGMHYKIPQVGAVIIEDDVEIGANVTIDRATTGNTLVGKGTKIDNLVQIGHNVKIGEGSILVSQVAIGGSTKVGRFVSLGGQVGVSDHANIEDGTMIGAQSGVMGHVPKGIYSGSPTIPHIQWLKAVSVFSKLPELSKRLKLIEDKLEEIQGKSKKEAK
ncbi:MAG: UDP-3-O-(3-hydroxymyristoyl)glucosamine N-acyltransferase [Nitrospirae bacterium]|nr:UDP-3-O-(3-hydroxymyristoyl)glucosamine N-acyltransferase [Nitrospirota bacterium]